jgi:hypothetical protein
MAFKNVTYTVGQKLSSTGLNNNYSNFAEIVTAPETEGQASSDPYFEGRPVKTIYFYGIGEAITIFGENVSSVTYPNAGTYQVNYNIPYQTQFHAINFQGVKDGSAEGRNFQFGCQSQTNSESTIYWRISDSGNTDVGQARFGVLVGYPSNGI